MYCQGQGQGHALYEYVDANYMYIRSVTVLLIVWCVNVKNIIGFCFICSGQISKKSFLKFNYLLVV